METKTKIKFLLMPALALVLMLPAGGGRAAADNTALQAQKLQKQQQLDQLNQQIAQLKQQIADKQKQSATLKNEVSLYDTEIQATEIQIQATQTNIENIQIQIQETKQQIANKNDQIQQEKQALADLVVTLNEYQDSSGVQLALGAGNFSDFLDQIQYTQSLDERVFTLLSQIKDLKSRLEQDQIALQDNLDKQNQLQQQQQQTSEILSEERAAKNRLLAQTRGQESAYQKLLTTTQSEEDKINQEIFNLDQQIQGKKNFNILRPIHGILAYPVDGVITQGYGKTGFTKLGYTFHNGVDIAGPPGTPISAAADGVVFATGRGQAAYGNWVVIKHTITAAGGHQIMTLYGHLRSFIVSPGQSLKQGDLIGYEGNTGNTSRLLYGPDRGYHLHFSVFDATDFGIQDGAYPQVYGPYKIPYGYTYNPMDFF